MSPRPVVGIDPSLTATGVAWSDGLTEVIKWPGTGTARLVSIYSTVSDWFDGGLFVGARGLVLIEGLSFGSKGSAISGQAELGAVMRLAFAHCCVDTIVVPPATLKKYATGKGNANKDLVRDAARDRLGLPAGVTSDECDAAFLRCIGLALLDDPAAPAMPKSHLVALDKLDLGALEAAS